MQTLFYDIYSNPLPKRVLFFLSIVFFSFTFIVSYIAYSNYNDPLGAIIEYGHFVFQSGFVYCALVSFCVITYFFLKNINEKILYIFTLAIPQLGFLLYDDGSGYETAYLILYASSVLFLLFKILIVERPNALYFWRYLGEFSLFPMLALLSIYFSGHFNDTQYTLGRAHELLYSQAEQRITYDAYLYAFDSALGLGLASILPLALDNLTLNFALMLAYLGLIGAFMICQYLQRRYTDKSHADIVSTFALAGLLSLICYSVFPACGILCLFDTAFPYQLPAPRLDYVAIRHDIPSNAMPSLHFTWGLMLAFQGLFYGKKASLFFIINLILISVATIALGEHFLIDLIVAVPYTLFIQAICTKSSTIFQKRTRWLSIIASGALVISWFVFLLKFPSFYYQNSLLCWLFVLISTGLSITFFSLLYYAARTHPLRTPDIKNCRHA
ncbi:MAG: phosphatase PAP2 family protein [Rickettsiales bacterium]